MSTVLTFATYFLLALWGFIFGMLHAKNIMTKKPDGIFYMNLENPNEDTMKLQIDVPIEEIPKQQYLIFRIQKTQ